MSAVSRRVPLAGRVPLSAMRSHRGLRVVRAQPLAVSVLPTAAVGDGGHGVASHAAAFAALVCGGLSGHDPHAGVLGGSTSAAARPRSLRDCLDDAPEAPPRDATAGARPDLGDRRSGRDLRRRRRGRTPRRAPARRQQGDRRRCGRSARPRLGPHPTCRPGGSVGGVRWAGSSRPRCNPAARC